MKNLFLQLTMMFCLGLLTCCSKESPLVSPTNTATYYVRTDGNDSNNGLTNSSAGAWKTIKASVGKLVAGDNLLVADGTYNEYEVNIDFTGGSKTVRTTIQSINKWGAKLVLDGPSNQGMAINANGVIIDKFEITWAANPTSDHKGIEIYGNWTTISNCNVHHCPFSGISGAYCDNVLIENNVVHDNYSMFSTENGSGISIWDPHMIEENVGGYNIIIRNNICYNNWATSNVGSVGEPTDGNGIILDDFHNSQTPGGQNYTYKTLVENNLCFNNGGRGIHNFYSDNVTIRNNTVYGNNYILKNFHDVGELENTGGLNVAFYNNISVSTANLPGVNALKITLENSGSNITKLNNNILCGSNPFSIWTSNTTLTGGGNSGNVTNTSTTYPAFANPTTGIGYDFHLQATSPAINVGNNSKAAAIDLDGLTRPKGSNVEPGCYEYAN